MSNRLSKGKVSVGKVQSDVPGDVLSGVPFSAASTAVGYTSFSFPVGAIVSDFYVKITSVSATSGSLSIGLATGASSAGVAAAYVTGLSVGTTGTYVMNASTSAVALSFTYGSYLIASTSAGVTILKNHAVGSTDTYFNLTYTSATTTTVAGVIYPLFHELA
jgi:hypothetical protein